MRLSRPKDEAPLFAAMLESEVKKIHPAYERNKRVRGIRTEFIREIQKGVFASHWAICRRGHYHHGFCVTLHRDLPDLYLVSPFVAGGRFDWNYAANRAVQHALGHHMILSDSHEFRKGYERIINRCTEVAEQILLPHYVEAYQSSKEALRALYARTMSDFEIIEDRYAVNRFDSSYAHRDLVWFARLFRKWKAESEQFVEAVVSEKPELFLDLREKSAIDPDSLV